MCHWWRGWSSGGHITCNIRAKRPPPPPPSCSHLCSLPHFLSISALSSLCTFFFFFLILSPSTPSICHSRLLSKYVLLRGRPQSGANCASLMIKVWQFVPIMAQTMWTSYSGYSGRTLHWRGLINDYLHVEINQYGNCAKPIPISSGFFY